MRYVRTASAKRRDAVCRCDAYRFPHRQFSGRCSLQRWVDQFYEPYRKECSSCVHTALHDCQVVQGVEQPAHCPELREYIRYEGIVLYGRAKVLMDRATKRR